MASWIWGTSQFDEAVDKATSELLPSGAEDIALNLEICDMIQSKSTTAKEAMRSLKRRLNHKNPNVQLLALSLTDICVKNGGDHFLVEVASREFMDNLVSILKIPALNVDVKNKILRLVQNWGHAFEGKPTLSYVGDVYQRLKSEGFTFPPRDLTVANSAMVDTQTAPEWIDSDVCLRCRTPFTFTNRKHHCRNCGQVFDHQCSSKNMALPHFGIRQEVRVCDTCYVKLKKKKETDTKHSRKASSSSPTRHKHRSARDLADAELQRAIELSLKDANTYQNRPGYAPSYSASQWQASEPPLFDRKIQPNEDEDEELKLAIEASLREANAPRASAPMPETPGVVQDSPYASVAPISAPALPTHDLHPLESDAIMSFSQTVTEVHAQGGRDLSRYPVNEMYDRAVNLRPKLVRSMDDAGRKEQMLSEMHEKLSEAVRLYDHLLSEQVSRPAWRAPSTAATSNQMYRAEANQPVPAPAQTHQAYQPASPVQQAPALQRHNSLSVRQSSVAYAAAPQGPNASSTTPYHSYASQNAEKQQYQQQWLPAPTQAPSISAPVQPLSAPTPLPDLHHAVSVQSTYSAAAAAPAAPIPVSIPQYIQPAVSKPAPTALPQSPPPISQPQQAYTAPLAQPSVPVAQSPPLQSQQQYQSVPPAPVQQQHAPPTPSTTVPTHTISRQNTLSHHAAPVPQQHHYTPHAVVSHATTAPLPAFPTAPTSAPQSFPMYGPPVSVERTEPKEAMLISFD